MALVHVERVTENWPLGDPEEAEPNLTTIDCVVNGTGYVRMGYHADEIDSADDVKTKLKNDAAILLDPVKQKKLAFPVPSGGRERSDWIPSDFSV